MLSIALMAEALFRCAFQRMLPHLAQNKVAGLLGAGRSPETGVICYYSPDTADMVEVGVGRAISCSIMPAPLAGLLPR